MTPRRSRPRATRRAACCASMTKAPSGVRTPRCMTGSGSHRALWWDARGGGFGPAASGRVELGFECGEVPPARRSGAGDAWAAGLATAAEGGRHGAWRAGRAVALPVRPLLAGGPRHPARANRVGPGAVDLPQPSGAAWRQHPGRQCRARAGQHVHGGAAAGRRGGAAGGVAHRWLWRPRYWPSPFVASESSRWTTTPTRAPCCSGCWAATVRRCGLFPPRPRRSSCWASHPLT